MSGYTGRAQQLRLAIVLSCLAVLLAACSAGSGGRATTADVVTVGSGSSLESQTVAELYAQELQAKGVIVHRHLQIGAREIYLPSIEGGEIDLLPEYTGELLTFYRPEASLSSASEVESTLRRALPSQLEILTASPAEDRQVVVVTRAFATRNQLSSITDLAKLARHSGGIGIGVGSDVPAADVKALTSRYAVSPLTRHTYSGSAGTLAAKALADGSVDAAVVDSTNPVIDADDLVVLSDPLPVFTAQNVVPLIRRSKADARVRAALDAVSQRLTTQGLRRLDALTTGRSPQSPANVAAAWLKANDLG